MPVVNGETFPPLEIVDDLNEVETFLFELPKFQIIAAGLLSRLA
ncbi:hypothetical protein L901_06970 [Agrobacterium sp. D14]|nr:hypothetical protein L901_06970 [Agrobacterium sp. D14]